MAEATPLALDHLPDWTGTDGLPSLADQSGSSDGQTPAVTNGGPTQAALIAAFEAGRAEGLEEARANAADTLALEDEAKRAAAQDHEQKMALIAQLETSLLGTILPAINAYECQQKETFRQIITTIETLFYDSLDTRLVDRCQKLASAIEPLVENSAGSAITIHAYPDDISTLSKALSDKTEIVLCDDETLHQGTCRITWQGGDVFFDPFEQADKLLRALNDRLATPPMPERPHDDQ